MKNRYKGFCVRCTKVVKPGEGLAINRQGAWFTIHEPCNELEKDLEHRASMARNRAEEDRLAVQEIVQRNTAQRPLPFER